MTTTAAVEWPLWSTTARLVVTDQTALLAARRIADAYLAEVEQAASRFSDESEINNLVPGPDGSVFISPMLADLLEEALAASWLTEGAVDPTVGNALVGIGYDRDIRLVMADHSPLYAVVRTVPGWRKLRLDGRRLRLPQGVQLDLGATAKAVAADRVAQRVHCELRTGVLVSLGGDIATAGEAPVGGWQVQVQDQADDPVSVISLPGGGAVATSSTVARRWTRGRRSLHHIIDPRTGAPADPVWRSVTVAAATCARANALTTASVVHGQGAPSWLERLGHPARLLHRDGAVVTVAGWPAEAAA